MLRHDAVPSESLLRALIAGAALALVAGCAGFSNLPRADLVADIDWSGLEPVEVKGSRRYQRIHYQISITL